jgi:hypothetical protein
MMLLRGHSTMIAHLQYIAFLFPNTSSRHQKTVLHNMRFDAFATLLFSAAAQRHLLKFTDVSGRHVGSVIRVQEKCLVQVV